MNTIIGKFQTLVEIEEPLAVCFKSEDDRLIKGLVIGDKKTWFDVEDFGDFCCNRAKIEDGINFNYIDRLGNRILPDGEYLFGEDFSEDRAFIYRTNSEVVLIDINGAIIKELGDVVVNSFSEGFALIYKITGDNTVQKKFINRDGEFVLSFPENISFESVEDLEDEYDFYSDGLIRIKKDAGFDFLNIEGIKVLSCNYSEVTSFVNGLAAFYEKDKCGFIDKSGKIVVPAIFEDAANFFADYRVAMVNELWGLIDSGCTTILPFEYDELFVTEDNVIIYKLEDEWGLMDSKLNVFFKSEEIDELEDYREGIKYLIHDDRYWVEDTSGTRLAGGHIE